MEFGERRACITGVGQSDVGRRLDRDPLALTIDACLAAIDDAGLGRDDIDGLSTYPGGMMQGAAGFSGAGVTDVHDALRLKLDWFAGGPEAPGYLNALGIPAGYVEPATWDTRASIDAIKQRFDIRAELIEQYSHPYIYLSREVTRREAIEREAIERAVAEEVERFPAVAIAISSRALASGNVPDMPLYRSVLENFSPLWSGDVFVVFEPYWFINDFDGLTVATTHGSPWRYDSFVPIVFAGAGIPAQHIYRRVQTVDVAPTLAALLGIKPPSASAGTLLVEVLEGAAKRERASGRLE